MFWFKQCPRCTGDLVRESDQYGDFVSCMQCGMCKDVRGSEFDPSQISLEPVAAPTVPPAEAGVQKVRPAMRGAWIPAPPGMTSEG